jgi:hypothetical protein
VPFAAAFARASAVSSRAVAQEQAKGFAVERFMPSAPGGGWLVMDDLALRGGLGGAVALTTGYARKPLRIASGGEHLTVVSDQAFVDVGVAATFDRFRFYLNLGSPLSVVGQTGTVGNYRFERPAVGFGPNPDTISDVRLGLDARLLGEANGAFRLGLGVQLLANSGEREEYITDGTYRAMGRVLFAGDVGMFAYAGHLGVHVRPLDESSTPGSPQGSELLFGVAAGPRIPITASGGTALVVGPELYGVSAFRSFFGARTTGVEALLGGRLEGTGDDGPQLRAKLGFGPGLSPHFGVPEWRMVFSVELFSHAPAP